MKTHHGELKPLQKDVPRQRALDRHSAQEPIDSEDANGRRPSSPNKRLGLASPKAFACPAIVPANDPLVPRHLVDKPKLLRCVLCHVGDEFGSLILVAFLRDALKLLAADTCAFECPVDGGIVYRYKAVGLEEIQQFVEKIVGILLNEKLEVMNIVVIEMSEVRSKALVFGEDIASVPPQLQDPIPSAPGEAAALKDIGEAKELSFVQANSGDLDIARDSAWHGLCMVQEETRKSTKSEFPYSSKFRVKCHKRCKQL